MRHRGPDDAGEWWSADGRAGLSHLRLSIIDLSPGGHQPMHDAGGTLSITFNGEIYNFQELRRELAAKGHAFRSQSDTEVILAAYREWGTACLSRLNGMFAFGIFDGGRSMLFLARDRAGEKPLFYACRDGAFRFASELKALMAHPALPRRIDPTALDCYLATGYVPGELCILQGAKKLRPGHALTFGARDGQLKVWRYWELPELDPGAASGAVDENALADEFEDLLQDAVQRQLVADVPVGVLLSGGMDSSLVTAMAARATNNVKTFTVRFPGHGSHDETEHARLIARHFGTDHIELDAGDTSADLLPVLARQFDEPVADSSMIPTYLVCRLVRQHCKVALGGDGGDELFGGYVHYNRLLWLQRHLNSVPRGLQITLSRAASLLLPMGMKGRKWLQALETNLQTDVPQVSASRFDPSERQALMSEDERWPLVAEGLYRQRAPKAMDVLQRATRMDFENYLPEDILVKVDRASMLNSLEMRAPLLDYRIVEFAFRKVPSSLKATATSRKILLKKVAGRVLPPTFDHRRKQGFVIPLAAWLRSGPWRNMFRDVLLGLDNTLFGRGIVRNLFAGQAVGLSNSDRLFALVLVEIWRREYRVSM